ncbi:hypothetical protein GP486_008300 [Trichoglossum hirsutum]|uniref:Uncharacterized protein n=1 Tax=Trichoglossum hirsutum TaxID=265104 RepID=A0A9P8IE86_9PEZI|nr:hypothetical protein GP486_008300 [Trichoglossum hirsutum]
MISSSDRDYWPYQSNIRNVRLVCRLFECLATPFLVRSVTFGPLSTQLATLTAISRHPVISKSISEIVYNCNLYRPTRSLQEYQKEMLEAHGRNLQRMRHLAHSQTPKLNCPASGEEYLELQAAFSLYRLHYDDQTRMEASGEVMARLCCALTRMPNVKKITLSSTSSCYLGGYGPTSPSKYFMEPVPAYNKAFLHTVRALSLTGAQVPELDMELNVFFDHEYSHLYGGVFQGMSNMDFGHCCDAFRGLRKVTMTVSPGKMDGWTAGKLAVILSGATELEDLSFYSCSWGFPIQTSWIFGTTTWHRLTNLGIGHVTLDQEELLSLLKRHSRTLKDLRLYRIFLTNGAGSWESLLEGIKACLSLETILITDPDDLCEEEIYIDPEKLDDYIMGNGPNPLSCETP